MENVEQSVLKSLDGDNIDIYSYLPYLLQDTVELGTSPEIVTNLIKRNIHQENRVFNVLDLGCGKGAVSLKIAKELGYRITGIDAMTDFINDAIGLARTINVENLSAFELGDIRKVISVKKDFDIIILGAIGPVFGDIGETLLKISYCLKPGGYVLIDDGYTDDEIDLSEHQIENKTEFYKKIQRSGFVVIDQSIIDKKELEETNSILFNKIRIRAHELIKKYPEKKRLFEDYIKIQSDENDIIENKIKCGVWLLKKPEI